MLIAYTHGRYQPLHNGHFQMFLKILEKHDQLWIGISNPSRKMPENIDSFDPMLKESVLRARAPENNPFSYTERQEMIIMAFIREGIDISRIRILPHYGFYEEKNWEDFMPPKENSVIALSPKDPHHDAKIERYKKGGWEVKIIPQFPGISGSVFDKAWKDGNWRDLVPRGAKEIIEKNLTSY